MVTLQEIFDFAEIERGHLEAIAELGHMPEVVAAELAYELIRTPRGVHQLHAMFLDAIERAECAGSRDKAQRVEALHRDFSRRFPKPHVL